MTTIKRRQKTNRLSRYDYSAPGYYFVTVCTKNRAMIFGDVTDGQMTLNEYGHKVQECWMKLPNHYPHIELDEYIVMPNHFHGIVRICDNDVGARHASPLRLPLGIMIGGFKSAVTKRINQLRRTAGQSVWQRNFHDRIIRNEEELYETRKYIRENPKKWELDPENIEKRTSVETMTPS